MVVIAATRMPAHVAPTKCWPRVHTLNAPNTAPPSSAALPVTSMDCLLLTFVVMNAQCLLNDWP